MGSRLKKSLKVLSQQAQGALTVYRMKATLLGTDPPVWRHVQVDGEFTLGAFHCFLQDVFGWEDMHLHQFVLNGECYMDRLQSRQSPGEIWDEDIAMCFLNLKKGQRIVYEYDFGDGWKHELVIDDIIRITAKDEYPMVLDGEGACPPEDCGGIPGYSSLIEAYKDKKHPRYKEARELLGTKFDPAVWPDKEEQVDVTAAAAAK
jgi:hypothetical protein